MAWEAAAATARVERSVVMRLGIVLDKGGGAMAKMMPIFQVLRPPLPLPPTPRRCVAEFRELQNLIPRRWKLLHSLFLGK